MLDLKYFFRILKTLIFYYFLVFRLCHFQPEQAGYTCIPCKKVFSFWRTFKRHREQRHGGHETFACQFCNYKTGRKDNLPRHVKTKHGNWKMVSDLVNDIIEEVDNDKDVAEEDEIEEVLSDEEKKLSAYERMRNKRVAQLQAEFRHKFPNFEEEVQQLKVRKKKIIILFKRNNLT